MTSSIDTSLPIQGRPTTASVRSNFAYAKAEIEALQNIAFPAYGLTATVDTGFYKDVEPATVHWKLRDRVFIGDAAGYSGNRLGANGYGTSWVTDKGASYFIKNATLGVAPPELDSLSARRYGIVGFSKSLGVGAVAVNDGVDTFARASYSEAFHSASGTGATVGHEIQVGNYTSTIPVANAYDMSASTLNGLYIGVESGTNYTVGDSDTAISSALNYAGAAIDIAGGSLGADYQKWVVGIVFRNGALSRDGSDYASAINLAQKHIVSWNIDSTLVGAEIWSEVTTNNPVGIKFEPRRVKVTGENRRTIVDVVDDNTSTGAVNWAVVKNSRTGIPCAFGADGADTNVSVDVYSKGIGVVRLMSHDGIGENVRVVPPANAPVDYITLAGTATGSLVTIGSAGTSTNIDISLSPKGSGVLRFGTHAAISAETVSGYITIKDAAGNSRKIAVVS